MLTGAKTRATGAEAKDAVASQGRATVAVVIVTYNQARFLVDAITSVLTQTRQADEIIVVDDGSTDNPGNIVAQYPKIKLFRQDNSGVSAARNTGLYKCRSSHVVFLDADDRLLPTALEAGLSYIEDRPDCAFVYGGYRFISEEGLPISSDCLLPLEGDTHLAFIQRNRVNMHAAVVYRRECLLALNGFDETLHWSEDYDLFLRAAQQYPVARHTEIVAEYRRHGQNTTSNHIKMLKGALEVLDRHEARVTSTVLTRSAFRRGRARQRDYRISYMLMGAPARWRKSHDIGALMREVFEAARWSPRTTAYVIVRALGRRVIKVLPHPAARWIRRLRGHEL